RSASLEASTRRRARRAVLWSAMRRAAPVLLALALVPSCASRAAPATDAPDVHGPPLMPGFDPGPVPAGFTRYVTPVVPQIPAGTDTMVCQWLSDPTDATEDVLAIGGAQSRLGHHVVLYATADAQPVGTSRPCEQTDMLDLRFL